MIKFYAKLKKTVTKTKDMLYAADNKSTTSQASIYRSYNGFKCGRKSVKLMGIPMTVLTKQSAHCHNHDPGWSSFNCETTCFVARHLDNECTYSSFDQTQSLSRVYSIDSVFILQTTKTCSCWSAPICDRVGSQQHRLSEQSNHRQCGFMVTTSL